MSRTVWIFLVAFLTSFLFIFPIIRSGLSATFYTIDPDVSYVSNALSYIKYGQIHYIDHPGTPTILLFSLLLTPARAYLKFVIHTPFILWSLMNLDLIFYLTRLVQSLIMALALGGFLLAVFRSNRSLSVGVFSWLSLLAYSTFPFLASSISPETLSFLIFSVWLNLFVSFTQTGSKFFLPLISIVSGIAIANKFSSLFLGLISICLPLIMLKVNFKFRFFSSFRQLAFIVVGFVGGTWTIRSSYPQLFKWVKLLANTSEIHGGGKLVLIDVSTYLNSVISFYYREPWFIVLILASLGILIFGRRISRQRVSYNLLILIGLTLLGVITFIKYPLSHYQLIHYYLLIFAVSEFFSFLPRVIKVLVITLIIPIAAKNIEYYYRYIITSVQKTMVLEEHISNHPAKFLALWEWGRSRDFATLWAVSPAYHGKTFLQESKLMNLPYFQLINQKSILLSDGTQVDIFSRCWDIIYTQETSANNLIFTYPNHKLVITPIPDSDNMVVIRSNHCEHSL